MDAQGLHRLGIAGLLRAGREFDREALVSQLAGYLAGPAERIWRHLVLDLDWELPAQVEIAGWRLWRPSGEEWDGLRPVPAAADYAVGPVWDPLLRFGEHVVLSVPEEQEEPVDGHRIRLFPKRRTLSSSAWGPFLMVNLWHDIPVSAVAEHLVEPRRAIDRLYSEIPSQLSGPEGEYESPLLGPLSVNETEGAQLIRFLGELHTRLQPWGAVANASSKKQRKPYARMRRSADGFLTTSDLVGFDGDVFFSEDRPQVAFNYVSALDNLVADGESGDLRRRTAQRVAVLLGRNDAQRKTLYDQVAEAYGVRNKIAHGDEPDAEKLADATGQLRSILRRALIAAIVLGPERELGTLCDDALLSHTVLREQIRDPLDQFRSSIRLS